jgi:hypothetical protein
LIVWVDDGLFKGPARDVDRLALLRNAALRRHTLVVSHAPDTPSGTRLSPNFDAWFAALPGRLRAEVKMLRGRTDLVSVTAVTRGATRILVSATDPSPQHPGCWLSLDEAVWAVAQPLYILVENQISDAVFLRRVMPPLWRLRLAEWERLGKLRYENGGGLTVMTTLVDFFTIDDNARVAFGLPAAVWKVVHLIVYDHDGDDPQQPSDHSRKMERSCRKAGMGDSSHRLERRDQEHYLPREALRQIVEKRITNRVDRDRLLVKIDTHFALGPKRHFAKLPGLGRDPFFKNEFKASPDWPENWFERDGASPEMTRLAERIAAAI